MAGPTPQRTTLAPEPGSFRDWDGRVFAADGRVVRALTETGLADWTALSTSDLYERFTGEGTLVRTERADEQLLEELQRLDPEGNWVAALSHERLPFVSYPYEWTFSMLRDAALAQLRLTTAALGEELMLKDATPYNIQWRGAQPVFIDIGSFERAREGEPWAGYRQFCTLYLFPLMLEAYRGIPFQPWLRGSLEGISPVEFRALFGARDALRRGMLRHVFLHANLERRYADRGGKVRDELGAAGFDKRLVEASVSQMTRLVEGLRSPVSDSAWRDYRDTCTYSDAEALAKDEFVRRVVGARERSLVWDLGCNDGHYSRIASETASFTVAVDSDPTVVDMLYRSLEEEGSRSILPLVVDLSNPSPALGWRNRERRTLVERGRPDLVLCLALVHHLSISGNVPLREIVDWLESLRAEVVFEFVDRDDPMVQRLLAAKRSDAHPDYTRTELEEILHARLDVVERLEASPTRVLYHARPR